MKRCAWDCTEIDDVDVRGQIPTSGFTDPFRYLPPDIAFTSEIAAMADRYESHDIDWAFYPAFQAASFIRPRPPAEHEKRRAKFASLRQQLEAMGFQLPRSLIALIETDNYVDRLRHNTIWLRLPDELWRLPADPEKLMFLVFSEGQGCCHWHLLLASDRTHCVVCCDADEDESHRRDEVRHGRLPNGERRCGEQIREREGSIAVALWQLGGGNEHFGGRPTELQRRPRRGFTTGSMTVSTPSRDFSSLTAAGSTDSLSELSTTFYAMKSLVFVLFFSLALPISEADRECQ